MSQDKPSQVYPVNPTHPITSVASPMPGLLQDPSIHGINFDQLINQRGIRLIHSKAIPCPNILTVDNNAHEPNCPYCDNNGFLHYAEKEIWGTFGGNSIQKTFEAHGIWETGTAVLTLPTEYPDGTQAEFNTYDKLLIPDFTVRLWELKEYEPRPGLIQDLRYPVEKTEYVTSIINGVQKFYTQGVDFNINSSGQVEWVFGKTPGYNASTNHGEVIAWAFFAMPVYLVVQTLRELRITQELVNGQKVSRKLPQSILVKRDFLPDKPESIAKP